MLEAGWHALLLVVMDKIYYQIAEQIVEFRHPQVEQIRLALAKYEPFLIAEHHVVANQICLTVESNQTIALLSEDKLVEEAKELSFHSAVYLRANGTYYLQIRFRDKLVEGLVSADWRHLKIKADWTDLSRAYLIDRLIMICYTMATLPLGYLKVHASVTELNGRALVFMGVSGTGKSTHSRLWRKYIDGATLLNDDEPIVRPMNDGSVRVYGCPWSGSTPCYRNESAEVAAFVRLYQASENKLTKLSGRASFEELFSSCAFMSSVSGNQLQVFDSVARVLQTCSVYRLDNRPDEEAVSLSYSLMK